LQLTGGKNGNFFGSLNKGPHDKRTAAAHILRNG